MPSLLSLSPLLADQTFPRDDQELRRVALALGELSSLIENETVQILSTDFFQMMLQDFVWEHHSTIRNDIYTHLRLWFLQGKSVRISTEVGNCFFAPHPIPHGCRTVSGLETLWADEMGKLLVIHDRSASHGKYCIGVACEKAFAGDPKNRYEPHSAARFFPLVGPTDCDCRSTSSTLDDAYEYDVPVRFRTTSVSFETVKNHCFRLGASEVITPQRGSHYKVKFPRNRSWVLDPNNDPVPDNYLKQLEEITGYELPVIKYILLEKQLPPLRPKLPI